MRQTGKQILTLVTLCALLSGVSTSGAQALLATVVVDPLTGVAMDGYDPVSYFTEASPARGLSTYEYGWAGVAWYFETAANRDIFMRNPEVYAPQFDGHCAMSLARGFLSDGQPQLYAVHRLKLYLFYSTANRAAFELSPEAALTQAVNNWLQLPESPQVPAAGH